MSTTKQALYGISTVMRGRVILTLMVHIVKPDSRD